MSELIAIDELLADPVVDPVAHLDPDRVARYAADVDAMPPVVAFRADEGLLLADGYHRVAAARAAGRSRIDVDVRRGTRADAMRYAVQVAARERGISEAAAMQRIQRWADRPGGGADGARP
jgi:ParB-like chromosome segregation protein Spo0J